MAGVPTFPAPTDGSSQAFYSADIDLTTTGVYTVIPPSPFRLRNAAMTWEIRTTGGTVSVSPTFSIGSNSASFNNYSASQTVAGFTSQAAETALGPTTISPAPIADISVSGLKVNVTAGATGSSPVLTARLVILAILLPI